MKKKVAILGSTGSIGKNLIKILEKDKKNISIELLSANRNYKELIKQAKKFNVKNIIIKDKVIFKKLKDQKKSQKKINLYNDFLSFNKIFSKKIDYVMSSISGFDGLEPTINIIKYTRQIAIANKEAIICGWSLINKQLLKHKTKFIPIDSEHFSIQSLIKDETNKNIDKVFITASGGPFLNIPFKNFKKITIQDALNHPNWQMGNKITIDSATMINKVFEVIEAKKIFDLDYKDIKIIIHPKSYVHSLIKFKNGITKLLVHDTNMTIPIFNSLYKSSEKKIFSKKINFKKLNNLNFQKVNLFRFPAVKILKKLPLRDSLYETVIVSCNDVLVDNFLKKRIKFTDISIKLLKLINTKEFIKFKKIYPKNINQIKKLNKYVSVKANILCI